VRLRSLLTARGIQVVTTRESDAAVEPDKRAEIANHAQAQACLSLHASDNGSGSGLGVHLFASSLSPAQPTRFAAWKTAQAAWVTRSLALEGVLNSALQHAGMSVTLGRTSLPVVDSMTCPAVAVEIAPEMGPDKKVAAGLDDPDYQARVADALAAALVEWRSEAHQP
jgi:N-acetylmuramoyl-L-alanine amidase